MVRSVERTHHSFNLKLPFLVLLVKDNDIQIIFPEHLNPSHERKVPFPTPPDRESKLESQLSTLNLYAT